MLILAVTFLYGVSFHIYDAEAAVKAATSYENAKPVNEGSTTIIYKHNSKTWNKEINVVKFVAPSDGNYQVKISNISYKHPASIQMSVEYYDGGYHRITFEGGKTNDKGTTGVLQAANRKYQKQEVGIKNWPKKSDWTNLEMKKGDAAWFNVIANGTDMGNIKFILTVKKTSGNKRLVKFPHIDNSTPSTDGNHAKVAGTARYGRDCLRWAEKTREFVNVPAGTLSLLYPKCPMEPLLAGETYFGIKYDEPQFYDVAFQEGGVSGITLEPYAGGAYEISIWGLNTYNGKPVEKNIRFRDEQYNELSFQGLEGIRDNTVTDRCAYNLCSDGYRVSGNSSDVIVINMETNEPINILFDKSKIYTNKDVDMVGYEWHIKIAVKRIYKDTAGGSGIIGGQIGEEWDYTDVDAKVYEDAPLCRPIGQVMNVAYTDGEAQTIAYKAEYTANYTLIISGLTSNMVRDFSTEVMVSKLGLPLTFTGLETIRNTSKSNETCVYRLCDTAANEKGRTGMAHAVTFYIDLKKDDEVYITFNYAKDRSGLNGCTFHAKTWMYSIPEPDSKN